MPENLNEFGTKCPACGKTILVAAPKTSQRSEVGSSRLVRMPGADVEALFCVALLNTLDTQHTNAVLKRYLELFDKSDEVLTAMGRHPNGAISCEGGHNE